MDWTAPRARVEYAYLGTRTTFCTRSKSFLQRILGDIAERILMAIEFDVLHQGFISHPRHTFSAV